MLTSVLRSPVAIQINIEIVREFVAIRLFTMPPEKPKRRIEILSTEDDDK